MDVENMDRELQKRVWQRVQGEMPCEAQPKQRSLKGWLLSARENAADYEQLARQMGGKQAQRLRQMTYQLHHGIACVRGICRLTGEQVKPLPPRRSEHAPGSILTRCYHRELRLWQEARSRCAEPEYAPVFERLSRQAGERCAQLLEILGELE